jgi:drug/metabolite transporter (DMT)-like permease
MSSVLLGAAAGAAASLLYNLGVALQALEARDMPPEVGARLGLLAGLARRPRWLAGTALNVAGWPLQSVALMLAPLAVVQPALACGLVVLLVVGARHMGERVGRREVLAVLAIIMGVAALTLVAREPSTHHASAPVLAGVLAGIGLAALLPLLWARSATVHGAVPALAAGLGFAWSGLSTKFVADAVHDRVWLVALAWAAATGAAALLAMIGEMTALQRRPATQIAPLVFVIQVVVPVAAAPALTGERPGHGAAGIAVLVMALLVVITAAVGLVRSPVVRSLVDDTAPSPEIGIGSSSRAPSARTSRTIALADGGPSDEDASTMSPGRAAGRVGRDVKEAEGFHDVAQQRAERREAIAPDDGHGMSGAGS